MQNTFKCQFLVQKKLVCYALKFGGEDCKSVAWEDITPGLGGAWAHAEAGRRCARQHREEPAGTHHEEKNATKIKQGNMQVYLAYPCQENQMAA